MKGGPLGGMSAIPHKAFNIDDVKSCYMCKVNEIGDYKLRVAYEKLCVDGIMKSNISILPTKG